MKRTIKAPLALSILAISALALCSVAINVRMAVAQEGIAIPAPVVEEQAGSMSTETAVFAGGCFWGVQGVFQHVEGVTNAVSGYAGVRRKPRNMKRLAQATRAMPNPCASHSILAKLATDIFCRCISPSLTIRRS